MRYIIANTSVSTKGLVELAKLLGETPTYIKTSEKLRPKWNPYFRQVWGDFDHMRSLFPKDATVRCFVTSVEDLEAIGIKGHWGMYDMVDQDGVLDFYIGVPTKLDERAKNNGFNTNLAWLFIHELLHGKEQLAGKPDRTHEMEEQGRLKELLELHLHTIVEKPINNPTVVITHHALSAEQHTIKDVNEWHKGREFPLSRLGYYVGYHYVIERNGTVVQTRHHDEEGCHTLGFNRSSIGVCFMGNFDKGNPTQKQLDAWNSLYERLREAYSNIPTFPHRHFQTGRTCHGVRLPDDYFQKSHQVWSLLMQAKVLLVRLVSQLSKK
jgi:hypothetical protein